jgi:hypothetical protein
MLGLKGCIASFVAIEMDFDERAVLACAETGLQRYAFIHVADRIIEA